MYIGFPGWIVALSIAAGAVGVLPQLLPQESAHRRDVWRDWLRHRERMARLHLGTVEARHDAARLRTDHRERSG
jgi:hypothetical protein